MQNKRTFISFVGKGQIKKQTFDCYLTTTYNFGNNKLCSCRCFAEAVRKNGSFKFDEVVFIGTTTSSWSALLESCEESEFELWSRLFEQEKNNAPLSDDDRQKLQEILTRVWGKPVRISVHAPELLDSNCTEIFNQYTAEIFAAGNDILLDITHSFRWMPLLLTSAMQFKNAFGGANCTFEIIYGEYRPGAGAASPVRWLNKLVEGQETTDAIALFFQKFEADQLSSKLESCWSAGARAICQLSNHIQGNYFLPLLVDSSEKGFKIGQPLKQLNNTLKEFADDGSYPAWVKQIHTQLKLIYDRLNIEYSPQRFVNLADLLAKRKLYGQAILNICLAAEQSLVIAYQVKYGYDKHPGYDKLKEIKDKFVRKVGKKSQYYSLLFNISILRNQVAHGGLAKDTAKILQPGSLISQYNKILTDYRTFDDYLKNEFKP